MIDQNDRTFLHVRRGAVYDKLIFKIIEYDEQGDRWLSRLMETNDSMIKILNREKQALSRNIVTYMFDSVTRSFTKMREQVLSGAPDKKFKYDLKKAERHDTL